MTVRSEKECKTLWCPMKPAQNNDRCITTGCSAWVPGPSLPECSSPDCSKTSYAVGQCKCGEGSFEYKNIVPTGRCGLINLGGRK